MGIKKPIEKTHDHLSIKNIRKESGRKLEKIYLRTCFSAYFST